MSWLDNYSDMRFDPRLLMPGLKSIVCVAMNYCPAKSMSDEQYQLAAYAYGQDYHEVVKTDCTVSQNHFRLSIIGHSVIVHRYLSVIGR